MGLRCLAKVYGLSDQSFSAAALRKPSGIAIYRSRESVCASCPQEAMGHLKSLHTQLTEISEASERADKSLRKQIIWDCVLELCER